MAQRPMTSANMFTATWTEKDEAILLDLLHRKIGELRWEMKEASSPYERRHLRQKRDQYKSMLVKVESGDYNPDIIRSEFASADAYRDSASIRPIVDGKSKYIDTYSEIDFDYDRYFSKTRYYGTALPLFTILLTVVFLFVLLSSAILPQSAHLSIADALAGEDSPRITLGSIGYFKLGPDEMDFRVPNDGNWPSGVFADPSNAPEYGVPWQSAEGNYPEYVYLYADLHMVAIDITVLDVLRAFIRTPMLTDTRLDPVEDMEVMQGNSWYYFKYMRSRADDIKIEKDEDGNYDGVKIVRHIATYGTIIFLIATLFCALMTIVFGIGQLFSYTSRRVHVFAILTLLFALLMMLCPALIDIPDLSLETVQTAFDNYFMMNWSDFVYEPTATVNVNLLMLLILALPLVTIFLPFVFKNRSPKPITSVPKGNRKHKYPDAQKATKPGKEKVTALNDNGKPLARGSQKAYSANTPYRRPNER